jgi:transketolase C-terminal domain/subunit
MNFPSSSCSTRTSPAARACIISAKAIPARFLQFGIAEQNMMAAAGGLAAVGLLPVVTTFAVFCLRAIEQARLSLAYAKRNAKIVASHPGSMSGPTAVRRRRSKISRPSAPFPA